MNNKSIAKRFLVMILVLAMIVTTTPVTFAEPAAENAGTTETREQADTKTQEDEQAETQDGADEESGEETSGETGEKTVEKTEEEEPYEKGQVSVLEAKIDDVLIKAEADKGVFPEDAELVVEKADKKEGKKADKAIKAIRPDDVTVAGSYTFDIKVVDAEGNELQPEDGQKVSLSFNMERAADKNLSADVYHITEKEVINKKTKEKETVLEAEKLKTKTDKKEETVTAKTKGFSFYTVEFTYEEMQYVMEGGSEVRLSEILKAVGLKGKAESVSVSNEKLFSASEKSGEWIVTSHRAFGSEEWMKVTIDEVEYLITVTDDGGEEHVNSWEDLQDAIDDADDGQVIILDRDITATDDDDRLKVDSEDNEIIIDLNGYKLDRDLDDNEDDGHVFELQDDTELTIRDSGGTGVITGGYADEDGGAFWIDEDAVCNIEGGTITGNRADRDGGAFYIHGTLNMTGGSVTKNAAGETGGGIYCVDDGTFNLKNVTISGNTAEDEGGGLNVHLDDYDNATITDCHITNNKSKSDNGGAIRLDAEDKTLKITNTEISGNSADNNGGGIQVDEGRILMNGGTISGNTSEDGSGVFNAGGTIDFNGVTISDNKSTKGDGGGINNRNNAKLNDCTIKNNNAKGFGGGILVNGDGEIAITGGSITGNIAYEAGGGIWVGSNGTLKVSGALEVKDNKASDVYLTSGKKIKITGSLRDGDKKADIGVLLAKQKGVATSGYSDHNSGDDPYEFFTPEVGCSAILDDGEVKIITSRWGSFQYTINTAADGDVIVLDRNLKAASEDTMLVIPEGKRLTIDLNGHTLDRNRSKEDKDGHVIMVDDNASLTITDSSADKTGTIKGGYATNGGGINIQTGASCTIEAGTITDNEADNGGGVYVHEGGSLTISGGKIDDNDASKGAGIYSEGNTTLSSGSITDNSASGNGGGIYLESGTLKLYGGAISDNSADSEGGGIWHGDSATLEVKGAPNVTGNSATIGSNILLLDGNKITVTDELTEGSGEGEGAHLDLLAKEAGEELTSGLTAHAPSGSTVEEYAKAIFTYNENSFESTMEIRDGELCHKNVEADVWVDSWTALQKAIDKSENKGKTIGLSKDLKATDDNDQLLVEDRKVTIELNGHTIDRNLDDDEDDGQVFDLQDDTVLTIKDSVGTGVITGGYADGDAGGIWIDDDAVCNIEGGTITGNKAESDGGGICVLGTLNMTGGKIIGNKAEDTAGGIYCRDDGTFHLKNVVISQNIADNAAGGFNVHLGSNASIENCHIMDNKSITEDGGAIRLEADGKTLTIKNTEISGNSAENNGGGIWVEEGKIKMTGGSITKNKSELGGGVYNEATIEFKDVTIKKNKSTKYGGGGINNENHAWLTDCLFKGNHSVDSGGAIYNEDDDLILTGCTFEDNESSSDDEDTPQGGAVYSEDEATITDCTFTSNIASGSGGGIYLEDDATVTNVTMTKNESRENGGGICVDDGSVTIEGGEITDNEAGLDGGGIYVDEDADHIKIKKALCVYENRDDDIYLGEDMKLEIKGALTDGEKKAKIGVRLEEKTGTFTDGFPDKNPDFEPDDLFTAESGYSVIKNGDGEGKIIESEWPQLQKLINDTAGTGDPVPVLRLERDWKAEKSDKMLTIPAGKSLIIDLNGHTLNRNRSSKDKDGHVITVDDDATLTIRDTSEEKAGKITGGYATNGGGINLQEGSSCTIESGIITGNRAENGGGVFVHEGASLTVSGGSIISNESSYGGGIYLEDGDSDAAQALITGGTISGNDAAVEGGGVWTGETSVLNVSDEPFIISNTGSAGKNILLGSGNVLHITGALTPGTEGGKDGARLDLAVKTSDGEGTAAVLTSGLTATKPSEADTETYAKAIFTYNEAGFEEQLEIGDDGEIHKKAANADVWVSDWKKLQKEVDKSSNEGKVIGLSKDIDARGEDYNICVDGDNVDSITIDLNGHTMDRLCDDDDGDGNVITVEDEAELTIKDSAGTGIITGGWSDDDGGGIWIEEDSACNIESGTITGNKAESDGGGICVRGKLNMTGGAVTENESEDTAGGIFCRDSGTFSLKNAVISGNSSENDGGGFNVHLDSNATIEDCRIMNNRSKTSDGGAIRLEADDHTLNIVNTEISSNSAENDGGAIVVDEGKIKMTGGSISDSTSERGGAVYNDASIQFEKVTVEGNEATDDIGGGICNRNNATIKDCAIKGNTADEEGGGIYTDEDMTISGGKISANKTDEEGGGIYIDDEETTITETEISGNRADEDGGAIYVDSDVELKLTGCSLLSNKTKKSGGAIRIYDSEVTIENGTSDSGTVFSNISENVADEHGGGIFINNGDAELTLKGGNINSNSATQKGGGIFVKEDADEVNIKGAVNITDNNGGSDVYLDEDMKLTVTGALADGDVQANIGVYTVDGLKEDFTEDYSKYNEGTDPAEIFVSNEGYEVYLKGGKEAAFKEAPVDTSKQFIEKNSQMVRDWEKLTGKNWMSGISGERYLNEINIPGSHDSGTKVMVGNVNTGQLSEYAAIGGFALGFIIGGGLFGAIVGSLVVPKELADFCASFAETQVRYIDDQLNDGIRRLDVRVNTYYCESGYPSDKEDDGHSLWILHGKDKKAGSYFAKNRDDDFLSFQEVVDDCKDFLKKHPTECITLEVAIQGVDVDEDEALARLNAHIRKLSQEINPATNETYLYTEDGDYNAEFTHYPQLKDCRGQIVLMGDTVGNGTGGLDYDTGMSNVYRPEGDFHDNSEKKIKHLTAFYGRYGHDPLPTDGNNGKMSIDYFYSVGTNCTDARTIPRVTPLEYADDVLPALFDDGGLLTDRQGMYLGLVSMDGANAKNNKQVWITNFGKLEYCTVTVKSSEDDPKPKTYTVLKNTPITISDCIYDDMTDFAGWQENDKNKTIHYPGDDYTVKSDVTFTALRSYAGKTPVRVLWRDADDKDDLRPDELILTATKEEPAGATEDVAMKAGESWKKNLDYKATDVTLGNVPEGYELIRTNMFGGYQLTLTHTPSDKVRPTGKVTWTDNDNAAGKRPDSVTLRLLKIAKNGSQTEVASCTASAEAGWQYDFGSDFPQYENGEKVTYTLRQDSIDDYLTFAVTTKEGFDVRNILSRNTGSTQIEGIIFWGGDDEADRPDSVKVRLNKDGVEVGSKDVSKNEDGKWIFALDIEKNSSVEDYTITVDNVEGYNSKVVMSKDSGNLACILMTPVNHEHSSQEYRVTKEEPTCTEEGSCTVYEFCETCGDLLSKTEDSVPALGHDWGGWNTVRDATDQAEGLQKRVCNRDESHVQERTVPKKGHIHQPVHVEKKDATCVEEGNISYWKCEVCDWYFLDGAHPGTTWIPHGDEVLPVDPDAHDWGEPAYKWADDLSSVTAKRVCRNDESHVESETAKTTSKVTKKATEDKDGEKVYTAEFDNEAFSTQTKKVAIPKKGAKYYFQKGDDQKWKAGSGKPLTFTVKRSSNDETTFSHFTGIKIEGKVVAEKNYTSKSGSVIISLKSDYLDTFKKGSHKITAEFDDGSATASFKVVGKRTSNSDNDNGSKGNGSKDNNSNNGNHGGRSDTGDESNSLVWFLLMIGAALVMTVCWRKRRNNTSEK